MFHYECIGEWVVERTICPLCKGATRSNMLRNFENEERIKPEEKYKYIFGDEALEDRQPREFVYEEDEEDDEDQEYEEEESIDEDDYIYEDEEGNLYTEEDIKNGNFDVVFIDEEECDDNNLE